MTDEEWLTCTKDKIGLLDHYLDKDCMEKLLWVYTVEDGQEKDDLKSEIGSILGIFTPQLYFTNKPLLPVPTQQESQGEISLGTVVQGDKALYDFGIRKEELPQHLLITSRSGGGKTVEIFNIEAQLMNLGIPFLAFDFKRDQRHIIRLYPKLWVIPWQDLRFNPLQPPPKVPLKLWRNQLLDCFAHTYGWFHGSRNHMQEFLDLLYEERGAKATLHQLYSFMKDYEEKTRKRQDYYDVVLNRLYSATRNLGEVIDCQYSFPIEELLEHPCIIELDGLARDEQNLLVELFLFWIYAYRLANGHRGGLRHVLIFDEGKRVFDVNKEYRESTTELGITPVDIIADEIRDFGEALIVADQEPSKLTHSIKANTYTKITGFLGHGGDISDVAEAMDLDDDEREAITKLERGEWLVKLAGRYVKPFALKSSDFPLEKNVTDDEIKARMKPVLEQFERMTEPAEVSIERENNGKVILPEISDDAWKLLHDVNLHPFKGLVSRGKSLNFSGRRMGNTKTELISKGLIKEVSLVLSSRPTKFLVLTNVALNLLNNVGHDTRLWKHIQSQNFEHLLYQVLISYSFRKRGCEGHIEKNIGGRRVDVLVVHPDGRRMGIEVEIESSGDIRKKLVGIEKMDELIILAKDQAMLQGIREKLEKTECNELSKVRLSTVSQYLRSLTKNNGNRFGGNNSNRRKYPNFDSSRNQAGNNHKGETDS